MSKIRLLSREECAALTPDQLRQARAIYSEDVVQEALAKNAMTIACLDFMDWAKQYLVQYEGIDSWFLGELRSIVNRFEE